MVYTAEDAERLLGLKLHAWQKEFINDERTFLIVLAGRKVGKSAALGIKAALDLANKEFAHTDGILVMSHGQRQAKEIFLYARNLLELMGFDFARDPKPGQGYATATLLIMPNGNKARCLPEGYSGSRLRTYSFYKIIQDEAAFIPDEVDTAIGPCLAVHGAQWIKASTAWDDSGSFYDCWTSPDWAKYGPFRSSSFPHVNRLWLEAQHRKMTKKEYDREFNCVFTSGEEGAYTGELLAAVTAKDPIDWEVIRNKASALFLGVDFARFGEDENVIAEAWCVDDRAFIRAHVISSRFRTTQIVGKIMSIAKSTKKFRLVVTDEGGVGGGPTDQLVEMLGKRSVIGVANQRRIKDRDADGRRSTLTKADLHSNLIRMMEHGRIVLDKDALIIASLKSMKPRYTERGDLTFFGKNSHAAEAIVRAVLPMRDRSYKRSVSVAFVPHSHGVGALNELDGLDKSWEVIESPQR